jgi:hypothetical protein
MKVVGKVNHWGIVLRVVSLRAPMSVVCFLDLTSKFSIFWASERKDSLPLKEGFWVEGSEVLHMIFVIMMVYSGSS